MPKSYLVRLTAALTASRRGATAIEYGLLAALVAVAIVGGVTAVGTSLNTNFTETKGALDK